MSYLVSVETVVYGMLLAFIIGYLMTLVGFVIGYFVGKKFEGMLG